MSGNSLAEQEPHISAAVVRPLEQFQIPDVLEFLRDEHVPLASCTAPQTHVAICRDACVTPQVMLLIATDGGQVCGAAVLITSRTEYWRRFWIRHPTAFCAIVGRHLAKLAYSCGRGVKRFFRERRTIPSTDSSILNAARSDQRRNWSDADCQRRWRESGPEIAKLEYIAVKSSFRRQRVGANLLTTALRLLETRGVKRVDAQISPDNTGSILLHKMLGASIFYGQSTVVASFDIGRSQ